uniref:NADH dehydrogenase subunit 6 n=1 Tax=Chiropterargas boueti TaxID=1827022 RepID=A0A1P8AG49_9ACAR|nr:NADH dehydrogenase subunit 6 [Chiropterargas boueti]AMX74076.1 NADH dehydrogenase subunit 6 [Chiropterargas boueti]AMX74089.1 NADH dehydrogenase subunit 6 [Chiropterargas boueti]
MKPILLMSILFMASMSPMSMVIIMIMMTINLSIFMYMISKNSWYPLIITLLILGGLLVLLLYVVNLTPNIKLHYNYKMFSYLPLCMLIPNKNLLFLPSNMNYYNMMYTNYTSMVILFSVLYLLYIIMLMSNLMKSHTTPLNSN